MLPGKTKLTKVRRTIPRDTAKGKKRMMKDSPLVAGRLIVVIAVLIIAVGAIGLALITKYQMHPLGTVKDENATEETPGLPLSLMPPSLSGMRTHIQTSTGKLTHKAQVTVEVLRAAKLNPDYEGRKPLWNRKTNVILTNPENESVADEILKILQPLDLGPFIRERDAEIRQNEVHILLVN